MLAGEYALRILSTEPAMISVRIAAALAACLIVPAPQDVPVGYDDTPMLPNSQWRVHDGSRPQPTIVTPGAVNTAPPSDAIVLFGGDVEDLDNWAGGPWSVVEGTMEVNGKGTIETKEAFGDIQLHLEFSTAPGEQATSQGRSNSGVFFQRIYEVQILDSYRNKTYPDGQAAALYGQQPPMVNASRRPGDWQTYDIIFRAPRFGADGKVAEQAQVTVIHNGVVVHHAQKLLGKTAHRTVASYGEAHGPAPLALQDHGNPVRFRNIWVRPLDL